MSELFELRTDNEPIRRRVTLVQVRRSDIGARINGQIRLPFQHGKIGALQRIARQD